MFKKAIILIVCCPLFLCSQSIEKIHLFLDCSNLCDEDYLIRKMPYINFMREASDSHVQLIVKSEYAASGGERLSFRFIGLNEFDGMDNLYFTNVEPNASEEVKRLKIADLLKKGLFSYVLHSKEASQFDVNYRPKENIHKDTIQNLDKWI